MTKEVVGAVFICLYLLAVFLNWLVLTQGHITTAAFYRRIAIIGAVFASVVLVLAYSPFVEPLWR